MGIDILGIDIMGVDILGIDIVALPPNFLRRSKEIIREREQNNFIRITSG